MPEEIIRETISVTRTSAHVSDEEKEIAGLYNKVVRRGLKHALHVLEWGTPDEKMRVTTASIQSAARLAALDAAAEIEESRAEFERLITEVTDVGGTSQIIVSGPDAPPPTPTFIDATAHATTSPLALGPHDQDERT